MEKKIIRYKPDKNCGLTDEQVKMRKKDGLVNIDTTVKTKSILEIMANNIFTLFNFLNLGLGLAIFLVGSYKNLIFLGVVICNTLISIIQEIRSKMIIDKLSIISATKVKVIRNGLEQMIKIDEIVLDDIIEASSGEQVVTDAIIVDGSCEVNEALITGESNPIYKKKGDMLLSGSFIVSGKCLMQVEHVGKDNYTYIISKEAKYIKRLNSELMKSLKKVIKTISIIIVPLGLILFYKQLIIPYNNLENAVVNTVAALIGMIPEGLILLTSTVLAVSIIRLAKYKVLVQELYCIEMLARADILCLDKTGTITDGNMEVVDVITNDKNVDIKAILSNFAHFSEDNNATIQAIRKNYPLKDKWIVKDIIPFSSARKYSAITFEKKGSYILGAPEIILGDEIKKIKSLIDKYLEDYRVLLLCHTDEKLKKEIPSKLKPLFLILLRDKIRKEAIDTLEYFKKEGVTLKIISGDNIRTVSNIAKRVGIEIKDNCIDATTLKDYKSLKEAVLKYNIFGRVTPNQKRDIIKILKENGHTVAMIGDGVNDVLALKEADCGIAIATGSEASRNVSELVLLDSNFDAMPKIVAEGRRTINNIQRSATLFLVKTTYATILAILFLFINMPYPFMPIQLTLTSVVTIGIPSFILAIEPNHERIKGKFLTNVISKVLPTAFTIVINIIIIMIIASIVMLSREQETTLAVILTGYTGFLLLYNLCQPFNHIRRILLISMVSFFIIGVVGLRNLFSLSVVTLYMAIVITSLILIATKNYQLLTKLYYKIRKKYRQIFN